MTQSANHIKAENEEHVSVTGHMCPSNLKCLS